MCVNIDLGVGKTNEPVPTINISFDLSFSRLLLLECGGGPEKNQWFFMVHRLLSHIWAWLDGRTGYLQNLQ